MYLTLSLVYGKPKKKKKEKKRKERKIVLLEDRFGCDVSPPFVDRDHLVPNGPHEGGFIIGLEGVPHL